MSATTQPILPVVGPQRGELPENEKHRRGILRNVPLTPGPEQFHGISNPTSVQCYMIATIQGILHHSRVAQFCRYHHIGPRSARPKQERLEQHIRVTYEVLMSNCGYCQLYELLVRYWTRPFENEQDREIEVNSRFQKLFERYLEVCKTDDAPAELITGEQQDAVAAYRALISWLHKDPSCERGGFSEEASIALFVVSTSKVLECAQCHSPRIRQPTADNYELQLNFPYKKAKTCFSIDKLLDHNLSAKLVLRCEDCPEANWNDPEKLGRQREGEPFTDKTRIVHFPELLCMTLTVYELDNYGGSARSKHTVKIPLDLDLSSRSDVTAKKGSIKYKLSSVIKHKGIAPTEGHYICYSRQPKTADWYLCDDSWCTKSDFKSATMFDKEEAPYLLFYERVYDEQTRRSTEPHGSKEYEKPVWWKGKDISPEQQLQVVHDEPEPNEEDPGAPSPVTIATPTTIFSPTTAEEVEDEEEKARRSLRKHGVHDGDYVPSPEHSEDDVVSDDGVNDLVNEVEVVVEKPVEQVFEQVREDEQVTGKQKPPKKPHPGPKDSTYRPSKGEDADDEEEEEQTAKTQQGKIPSPQAQPDVPEPLATAPGVDDGAKTERKSGRVKAQPAKNAKVPSKVGRKPAAKRAGKKAPKKAATDDTGSQSEYAKRTVVQLKALMKQRKIAVARQDRKADLVAKLEADDKKQLGGNTEEAQLEPPAFAKDPSAGNEDKSKDTKKAGKLAKNGGPRDQPRGVKMPKSEEPKKPRKLAIKRPQSPVEEDSAEEAEQVKQNIEAPAANAQPEATTTTRKQSTRSTRSTRSAKRALETTNDDSDGDAAEAQEGRPNRKKSKKA